MHHGVENNLARRGKCSRLRKGFLTRGLIAILISSIGFLQLTPAQAWDRDGRANAPVSGQSGAALDLDLSSTQRSLAAPAALGSQTVNIRVGATDRAVNAESLLTPAESVAVWQVLSTGQQSLQLKDMGNAKGGSFTIGSWMGQDIASLVVPRRVTAINTVSDLSFTGNLVNHGVFSVQPNLQPDAASLASVSAANILNGANGSIASNVSMSLSAIDSITNAGQITSAGSLTLIAGSSIVNALPAGESGATPLIRAANDVSLIANNLVNSGVVLAQSGNINIASQVAGNIFVNNTGGNLLAQMGAVNVRDSLFSGKHDFDLVGGNVLSNSMNIWSGNGTVNLNLNQISGLLNINAGAAHTISNASNLRLGNINLVGDPTFFNNGDITIAGTLTLPNEQLAIIASGDVLSQSGASINMTQAAGFGGNVLIMAGAQFTAANQGTGNNTSGSGDSGTLVTVTGGSTTGGKIDLTNVSTINATASNGGYGANVTLVALAGTSSTSGTVDFSNCAITTGGNNVPSGNVTVIAGATRGTSIIAGSVDTYTSGPTNGLPGQGGMITFMTATPIISTANPFQVTGGLPAANSTIEIGQLQPASIMLTESLTSSATSITIVAGKDVVFGSDSQTQNIAITTGGSAASNTAPPGNVAIFAGRNIVANPQSVSSFNISLNTSAPNTSAVSNDMRFGGSIFMVAGADLDLPPAEAGPPIPNNTVTLQSNVSVSNSEEVNVLVDVLGASSSGGQISLGNLSLLSTQGSLGNFQGNPSGEGGGDVNLISFAGLSSSSGMVALPTTITMNTGGGSGANISPHSNANGNVTILAGAQSGTSITVGNINTAGSDGGGGGIFIATAQPDLNELPFSYQVISPGTNPAVVISGAFVVADIVSASASIGNLSAEGGTVSASFNGSDYTGTQYATQIAVTVGGNLTIGSVINASNSVYDQVTEAILYSSTIDLVAGGTMSFSGATPVISSDSIYATSGTPPYTGVNGGVINLTAQQFSISSGVVVSLSAVGTNGYFAASGTGGDGGQISITTTGTGAGANINIGNPLSLSTGYFTVAATGDTTSGNGGSGGYLSVTSGANINVDPGSANLAPAVGSNLMPTGGNTSVATGTGGTIILNASNTDTGSCASGCVYISNTLDMSGAASQIVSGAGNPGGNGGKIFITTNSSTAFNVGGASTGSPNGVDNSGILSANGNVVDTGTMNAIGAFGSGGIISVQNLGGGISVQANGMGANGATGSIEVNAADATNFMSGTNYGGGHGGQIILQANGTVQSAGGLDASGGAWGATQPGGDGGLIEIASNYSAGVLEIGATSLPVNGVQGMLTARGDMGSANPTGFSGQYLQNNFGSGGTIILSNSSGGIQIDSVNNMNLVPMISVAAAPANAPLAVPGGDGGYIRMYAPMGTVYVDAPLDASGGAASLTTQSYTFVSGATIQVTNAADFVIGQHTWLDNGANTTIAIVQSVDTSLNQVTFNANVPAAWQSNSSVNGYYQSGTGGAIQITSNSTTVFTVNTGATNNGVNGTLTANGFSGGTIALSNQGSGGINVASSMISAQPTDETAVVAGIVTQGGNGGNIFLQASNGPVGVFGTLAVNGSQSGTLGQFGPTVAGNGGMIAIVCNTAAGLPFLIGTTLSVSTPNGVQTAINANGGVGNSQNGDGGSVSIVNLGAGGIQVGVANGPAVLTVNTPDQGINPNTIAQPGNGGAISLQAVNGPLTINVPLNASGGIDAGDTNLQFSQGIAGSIFLYCNNTTQLSISPINNTPMLKATGWNGGEITVINVNSSGIMIDNSQATLAISTMAQAARANATQQSLVTGGHGASISLQAPNGPVLILGNLDASGGADNFNNAVQQTATSIPTPTPIPFPQNPVPIPIDVPAGTGTDFTTNQYVVLSGPGSVNGNPSSNINEVAQIQSTSANQISVYVLFTLFSQNPVLTAYSAGGDGGEIKILTGSKTPFVIGNATTNGVQNGTLSANAGAGANGGGIFITNSSSGGIILNNPTNVSVNAGNANTYIGGGAGGSISLDATGNGGAGQGGKVYVGGNLSVNGGASFGSNPGGPGGMISIISNTNSTVFSLGNAVSPCNVNCNGVAGILSATGTNGGSIGVKNLGRAGIAFAYSSIVVTASSGNGGNIDLEAPSGKLYPSISGTLAADAASGGIGGTIVLNAFNVSISNNVPLALSAQGDVGGTIVVTQGNTLGKPLVVGYNATATAGYLGMVVDGTSLGGNIILNSGSGVQIADIGFGSASTESISISVGKTGTITAQVGITEANNLSLNIAKGNTGTLNTTVSNLAFTSLGGAVTLVNSSDLTISPSSLQASNIAGSGAIQITGSTITVAGTLASTGAITLIAQSGDLTVNGNVIADNGLNLQASSGTINTTNESGGSGLLVGKANGLSLTAGMGGIVDINTSTGSLTLNVAGDGSTTGVSITNTGNVLLNMGTSASIVNFSLTNNLGSITTTSAGIVAENVTLNNQSASGYDSYSISLAGPVGNGSTNSVTIMAAGSIVQTAVANVITGTSVTLGSQNGNVGVIAAGVIGPTTPATNSDVPIIVSTSNLSVTTISGGTANINAGTSAVTITGVSTAGDFQLTTSGNITVGTGSTVVESKFGGITIYNNSTTAGAIQINGNVSASGGPVIIENDNTSGNISVANNISVSGFGRVWDYQGMPASVPTPYLTGVAFISGCCSIPTSPTPGTTPGNVTLNTQGTSVAYFGASGFVTASGPAVVNVNINGSPYQSAVVFAQNSSGTGMVNLGTGSTVTSNGTIQAISSLDLTLTGTTSPLANLQQLSTIAGSGVTVTGNTVTIQSSVSLSNLGGFNIASAFTVTLQNFTENNPVAINILSTKHAVIAGSMQFTNSLMTPPTAMLFATATTKSKVNVLDFGNNATLSSASNLSLFIGGSTKAKPSSTISAGTGGILTISTGAANVGSSSITVPGTIDLRGALSAPSGSIILDAGGSIIQGGSSTVAASVVSLQIGGINAGNTPTSQIAVVSITANLLTVSAGSANASNTNTNPISIIQGSGQTVGALELSVQAASTTFTQSASINLSGSSLSTIAATSNGLTISGPLSCGSCSLSSGTGQLAAGNVAIVINRPGGTLQVTADSISFDGTVVNLPSGSLLLQANNAISLNDTTLSAGTLAGSYAGGLLRPIDIAASGNVGLISNKAGISTSGTTSILAVGGPVQISANAGNVVLSGAFESYGGGIVIQASGSISGAFPVLNSIAVGTMSTNDVGGVIKITAGLTSSFISNVSLPWVPGTVPGYPLFLQPDSTAQVLGSNTIMNNVNSFGETGGVVVQNLSGIGAVINLSTSHGTSSPNSLTTIVAPTFGASGANLNLSGGTMIFNATGPATIQFDGSEITSNAYQPISANDLNRDESGSLIVDTQDFADDGVDSDSIDDDFARADFSKAYSKVTFKW